MKLKAKPEVEEKIRVEVKEEDQEKRASSQRR
jgi:hypothetical protein